LIIIHYTPTPCQLKRNFFQWSTELPHSLAETEKSGELPPNWDHACPNNPPENQTVQSLAKPCVLSSETRSDANRMQNDPNNRRCRIFFISTEINSYDVFCSTSHVVAK
jgi:hypothetical protein